MKLPAEVIGWNENAAAERVSLSHGGPPLESVRQAHCVFHWVTIEKVIGAEDYRAHLLLLWILRVHLDPAIVSGATGPDLWHSDRLQQNRQYKCACPLLTKIPNEGL